MRRFSLLVLFFILSFNMYADGGNTEPLDNRFVLGAGFTYTSNPKLAGGYFEFGIVLYKNILYIQNNFMLRGGGLKADENDYTVFTLSDKLIFGRNAEIPLKLYVYLEGGGGVFGNQEKNFFGDTYAITGGFGGGTEIFSEDFGGIYVEVGYIGQRTTLNYPVSGIIIQAGWRIYF